MSVTIKIEFIGWLINVTDINDTQWKPEINLLSLVYMFIVPFEY